MTRIAITTNPATAGWKSDVATRTDLEANFVDLYAASAASIPTISAGVALNFLRVNTGATAFEYRTASQVRNQINAQLEDAFLTSVAALGTAADKMIYTTAVDTAAETAITAAGRALIDDAAASDQRTTLGLVAGGAGDIWVEKAGDTMTGPLIQAAGTAANPSYAFSDSGAYRSGALKYAVSIGGVKIFEIDGNAGPAVGAYFYIGASNYPFYQVVGASPTDGGPVFYLYHNKAAGAASDYPGALVFSGNDSAGNQTNYSEFDGKILDATNGSEDGCVECYAMVAGAQTLIVTIGPGLAVNNGSLTLATDLAVTEGGTGASTAAAAFSNLKQDATTTATGVVELATSAETITGTDTVRAVTPAGAAAAYQPLDSDLTALAGNSTNGMWARTAAGTGSARTIAGTAPITVTNGDGVSGAPTIAISAATTSAVGAVYLNPVNVCLQGQSSVTWTNMPLAADHFGGNSSRITKFDLTRFTECRLVAMKAGTAAVAGAKLHLRYYTASSLTVGDYVQIGTGEVAVAVDTTNTILASGWVALAAGAKADVFLNIVGTGGDGVVDPIFGMMHAQFR